MSRMVGQSVRLARVTIWCSYSIGRVVAGQELASRYLPSSCWRETFRSTDRLDQIPQRCGSRSSMQETAI